MPFDQPDVLIVGGGVIGLTTAVYLADRGLSVCLADRQAIGREASWAGAGMLPSGNLKKATSPEARLRSYSASLWHGFSAMLREQTGIDNGYRVCGALSVFKRDEHELLARQRQIWTEEEILHHITSADETRQYVRGLNSDIWLAAYLSEFSQVRNPRHLQALRELCLKKGVEIVENVGDLNLVAADNHIIRADFPTRSLSFGSICITAGSWSATILQPLNIEVPVRPIRGQIVQLQVAELPFRCVIEHGRRYLVPREDGLILIGSTQEDVGFEKGNTSEGVADLLEFAISLVPSLQDAAIVRKWSGLRPASPDELPLLGPIPGMRNVFVGAGHFRSGLQMSLGSASILADLICGNKTAISLDGLSPDRTQQPQSTQTAHSSHNPRSLPH